MPKLSLTSSHSIAPPTPESATAQAVPPRMDERIVRFANSDQDSLQNKRNASFSANPEIRQFFHARKAQEMGEATGILGPVERANTEPGQTENAPPDVAPMRHQERQMSTWLMSDLASEASAEVIEKGLEYMHRQRAITLRQIVPNRQIVPKDLSVRIQTAHMSFRCGNNEPNNRADAAYIRTMVEVAAKKGFDVLVTTSAEGMQLLYNELPEPEIKKHLRVNIVSKEVADTWTEDSGRFNVDGKLSIPATICSSDDVSVHRLNIYRARALRFYPNRVMDIDAMMVEFEQACLSPLEQKFQLMLEFSKIDFNDVGMVAHESKTSGPFARGLAFREPMREDYTYQEGGNTLVGLRANGTPFALIGRDSAEFSRSHLTSELEWHIDDQLLKSYLGADLGIDASEVFLIEQPGEFHLDKQMVLMGPGQVLINNPVVAAKLAASWIEEMRPESQETPERLAAAMEWMHQSALEKQAFIDLAVADLESAGMEVKRLPLVFDGPLINKMNFANGEGGMGPDGKPFFVTNGGSAKAREFIQSKFEEMFNVEVFFVDEEASTNSLERDGGMGCRVTMQAVNPSAAG